MLEVWANHKERVENIERLKAVAKRLTPLHWGWIVSVTKRLGTEKNIREG